ncbi:MAG: Pr6Pr family membrane protein [Clostridia bacterium]
MLCKNRYFALVWRILGLGLGLSGLLMQALDGSGFMAGSMMAFFTIQTNIFTTALFLILTVATLVQIVKSGGKGEVAHLNHSFQLAFTYYITITFIVFWGILSWMKAGSGVADSVSNYFVHGIVPIWAIIDAILFLPHGKIKKHNAFYWLAYPLFYLIFIVIRAQVGGPLFEIDGIAYFYPYMFVEPSWYAAMFGSEWVMLPVVLVLVVLFWAFAKLYIFVDRKIGQYYVTKYKPKYYFVEKH